MGFLDKILGVPSEEKIGELLEENAILIDVRSESEFLTNHAIQFQNIPLDQLKGKALTLDKASTYVLVCASGVRSRIAVGILRKLGFQKVYNGGCWSRFR